ncbi:MAG TPA: bis(5'-nucleosyl)-tetraphosphatase [Candidatus Thermoplasmatota archaeon]|nr:bis(5'-nucleosyl)-tetraphosphatase [Candidatus Thermoplasmatota archaeon]
MSKVRERSCGAVVYTQGPSGREYLLLRYGAGHWGFPKGHVEGNESDIEAAQRELTEETSIPRDKQRLIPGFMERTDYSFRRGRTLVEKEVRFFIVESATRDVTISQEHTDHVWMPFDQAIDLITFQGLKRVLRLADDFLQNGGRLPRAF